MPKTHKRLPYNSTEALTKRIDSIRQRLQKRWARRQKLEEQIDYLCGRAEHVSRKIADDYSELQRCLRKRARSNSTGDIRCD